MMTKWLPVNLTANLPVYAHTMIGVGGLVVNDKKQILTITEKNPVIKGAWKLPGGYVEPSRIQLPPNKQAILTKAPLNFQTKISLRLPFVRSSKRLEFARNSIAWFRFVTL